MAKLCAHCGKKDSFFGSCPFYLTSDKILCNECASSIKKDIDDLYKVETLEEYNTLREKIIDNCNSKFNKEIVDDVINLTKKIYERMDFCTPNNDVIVDQTFSTPVSRNNETQSSSVSNTSASSGMFSNIGAKIKTLALVVTWIELIASIITGIVLMAIDEEFIFIGLPIAVVGPLLAWVSSFVLYGFGQLIENTDILVRSAKNQQ